MTTANQTRRSAREHLRAWFREATLKQWLRRAVIGFVGGLVLFLLLVLLAYSSVSLPAEPAQARTTVIRDAKGDQLAELFKNENRVAVPLDRVADVMEKAVVSAEDRHFYEHSGVDPIGITRALVNDVRGGN
ncbi:MAG: family penicillin-binding protein, partial [Actinomycetia bacterium]|nr:family penicillin-binding protein [Actinomycetes bacterium]